MTAELGAAFNYSDLQGLSTLRREAAADTPEARRAVAQQFEAMFLNMMLKEMRNASTVDGGLFDRDRMRFHEDMHDQQLALSLSQGRGIGLADSIMRQFGEAPDGRPASPTGPVRMPSRGDAPRAGSDGSAAAARLPGADPFGRRSRPAPAADHPGPHAAGPRRTAPAAEPFSPATPQEFVERVWPHAERAARRLGVDPEVLVAQAALETGWGRHTIRDGAGRESHNLFGIKATGGWSGQRATVSTLEFVDGTPERRREAFRAYGSVAQSFDDYVSLIRGSPRYREALAADTPEDYARALQAGGYATDPDYADKIIDIVHRGLPGRPAQVQAASADNPQGTVARRSGTDGDGT